MKIPKKKKNSSIGAWGHILKTPYENLTIILNVELP